MFAGLGFYKIDLGAVMAIMGCMTSALDDIRIEIDCPRCGSGIVEPYGWLKSYPFVQCECGARINVDLSESDIVKVDGLIAVANPHTSENDN